MSRKIFRSFFVLILVIGSVAIQVPQTARAAGPWYVTTTGDDNNDCLSPNTPCATINGAIGKASIGDTVNVAEGTYIGSGSEVVLIDKDITLSGGWNPTFTSQNARSTIDGQGLRRGIVVLGSTVTLTRFTVQNGFDGAQGGGILNNGNLTLTESIVTANVSDWMGGGIFNSGTMTISDTSVSNNSAGSGGSGGGGGGGIQNYSGVVTLNNSSVNGNVIRGDFSGSGINSFDTVILNNSTVSSNKGGNGEGIYAFVGTILIDSSTISGNETNGIRIQSGSLTLQNSILAGNGTSDCNNDISYNGTVNSQGFNIIGTNENCTLLGSDLVNVDPFLGQLVGPAGMPKYHPLLAGSPAIDAGNPVGCTDQNGNLLTTDQRGVARVGTCDIGAYEFTTSGPAVSLSVVSGSDQHTATTSAFSNPLQAAALDSQGSLVSGATIDFTAPANGPSGTFADTNTNTTSAVTDEGGVATASIFTANDQAGAYVVTASATGLGSVEFNLEQVDRPANDSFASAEVIASLPFSATVDISEATPEPDEQQICYSMNRTVWYSFTPTETTTVRADTQGSTISGNVNIYLAAGSGISNLQFLNCSGSSGSTTFTAEAGQKYYFQVGPAFGEIGTVQFNLAEVSSITGRVTDAATNAPLPGNAPPFAQVTLQRVCGDGCLEFLGSQNADSEGNFLFDNYFGNPLPAGTYQIEVSANLYQTEQFGPFEFNGVSLDVGNLPIDSLPSIGSIRGRLVEAATGKPVSQTFTPSVQLYRCIDGNCYEFVNSQVPDSQGQFRFETDSSGNPLLVGTYQVRASADQYQQAQTELFDVGEGMHRTVGNLRITSFPVRFSEIQPCADIPVSGGECVFSVKIWNGLSTKLRGATWSLAEGGLPNSFVGFTNFQTKDTQVLNLDKGKSKVFQFRFNVPANNSPYGTSICTRLFTGQGINPTFNTVGFRDLFCVYRNAGGFTIASPQEAIALAQENVTAASTGTDIEPNNSCQAAQDLGAVSLPFVLDGNLDSSQTPDVDFFRLTGTPGTAATIDLEGQSTNKGTLGDPFLGFFDSDCNLVALNDDSGSLNSRLEITIPADGVFILGATICCDSGFNGGGDGTYQLTVTPLQVIGSISGRVTDALTGRPLRGNVAPFAFVRLLQCGDFGCFDVNSQTSDSGGHFLFEKDANGAPLRVGNYMVVVSADQYQTGQTDVFTVAEGEEYDVGDVALTSFPVRFNDIQPCVVPAEGGICEFSVKITNGLSTRLSGKAWSIINGSGIGSFTNFTIFQTDTPGDVRLNPGKSNTLHFRFRVRGSVADGANICATVFVGQDPNALFNTVGRGADFCFVKGSSGFTLMSLEETQMTLQQMQIQEINPPDLFTEKKK